MARKRKYQCKAPGCENSIEHLREGAKTCSGKCRFKLHYANKKKRAKALEQQEGGE